MGQIWEKDQRHLLLTNTWQTPYVFVFKELTGLSKDLLIFMVIGFSVPVGNGN